MLGKLTWAAIPFNEPLPLNIAEMPGYSPGLSASRLRCVVMPLIA